MARFVALMNARAGQLGLTDTHFVNPDGLDAPGHVSSARDVTKLARVAMNKPFIRSTVRLVEATAAGRQLHTWNDLLSTFPGMIGVKTGHTDDAGWSEVAAARGAGVTIYATLLGGETSRAEFRPRAAARLGAGALPDGLGHRRHAGVRVRARPRTAGRTCGSSRRSPRCAPSGSTAGSSSASWPRSRLRCPSAGAAPRARCRCSTVVWSSPARRSWRRTRWIARVPGR